MSILRVIILMLTSLTVEAAGYELQVLVPSSPFHGVHGMDFDSKGILYVGDIMGMSVHKVDIKTGTTESVVGPPYGGADDVKVGPDGTLVWTNLISGIIFARSPDGIIRELATGLPGINTVGFHPDGRLFATQPRGLDALYEIDMAGIKPPRIIFQPSGGLNGFVIMDDGYLYGPQGTLGTVVRVDLASGKHKVLADGFHDPTGVKSDSRGNLYVNELVTGTLYRFDPNTGEKTIIAQLSPGNDNITISADDLIYVSNPANNSIEEVNPRTGHVRDVLRGNLSVPGGLAIQEIDGTEWIYVADMFTTRRVNAATGKTEIIEKTMGMSTSAYPSSATVNGNHLVLSSWARNEILVQDLDSLEPILKIGGLKAPHDALELKDGSFLVAEMGAHRVVQMSGRGEVIKIVAENMDAPIGLAPNGNDVVYVTDASAGTVSSINLKSGKLQLVAGGMLQPEGIAVDHDGRILIIDAGARALVRFDPESGQKEILLTDLPVGLQGPPPMHKSWIHNDVVVGRDGTIYLNSDTETALYKVVTKKVVAN